MEDLLRKFLLLNNYDINFTEFNHYFQSHPDYPNLNAVENTLNHFQIESLVLEFENEDLENLPDTFITLLKSSTDLVLVIKENEKVSVIDNKNKKYEINVNEFLIQWTGIVVAVEEKEKTTNIDVQYNKNQFKLSNSFFLLGFIGLILVYSLWKFNLVEIFTQ